MGEFHINSKSIESNLSYYGWVVVAMSFLANLVGFGLVYAYGVFFKPLASEFGWSRSVTAGAFSFYAIVHNILAFFAGRLVDKFGLKPVLTIGGFCLGLSMIFMSRITSIWEIYFFCGIIFSIGIAGEFTPVMATVSRWFKAKRGFATGLTASGLGAGSVVFSPLCAYLISSFGWRQAYVIIGIISWAIFIPIVIFIKDAPREIHRGELESTEGLSFHEAIRTRTFWAYGFSLMFICVPIYAIHIHIVPLCTDFGLPLVTAGILAGVIGVGGIIGRISAGFLSDIYGRKRILVGAFIFEGIIVAWLLFCKEMWMFFLFGILFGLSSGGCLGIVTAFPADYFGYRATGSILGFAVIMAGVGVAIGPYLGGYIFDATKSYNYMVVMCIIATIAAIISASHMTPVTKASSMNFSSRAKINRNTEVS